MKTFLLVAIVIIVVVSGLAINFNSKSDYSEEPTHTMTIEEMEQVCREEGIPLD